MSSKTLSYSPSVEGFPTFYSYIPDYIIGMNNNLYTFKGGNLYKHHDNNTRGRFYGVNNVPNCSVTSVFNPSPTEVKLFKTIALESDDSWDVDLLTDLQTGIINEAWFELKEGSYFSFVRADNSPVNFKMRSVNGIGRVSSVVSLGGGLYNLVFTIAVDSIMSIGDSIYFGSTPLEVGAVTAVSADRKTITVNATAGPVPSPADFILYAKNQQAESHGVLGYYCEFKLENNNTQPVELFSVASSIFKSYP
jgi:hypothetical protein